MLDWFIQLSLPLQFGILYIVIINVITFFAYGLDKLKSQVKAQRISERMLWLLTLMGGSIGALAGMHFFRHKTKKVSFQLVVTLILLVQIALLYWIFI